MFADPRDADRRRANRGGRTGRERGIPARGCAADCAGGDARLAAACWAVTAWLMDGMDMGVATRPGAFGFFAATWVTMMAAMMLPGAAPAIARHARMRGAVPAATLFAGTYLAIWALAGVLAFALTRPHSSLVAGAVVIAAGCYELTPA